MVFTPPTFSKFGKSASDLLKKEFDFKNTASSKTTTKCGLTTEIKATLAGSAISTNVKANYKNGKNDCEVSLNTSGAVSAKAVVPYKVMDNLKLTVSGSGKPDGKVSAEFKQDAVNATADVAFCGGATGLNASLAFGSDGMSVGGVVKSSVGKDGAFAVKDYNFGVNYAEADFAAALTTANNASEVNVSFWQKVSDTQELGAVYNYNIDKDSTVVTVGSAYKLDNNTTFKVKCGTTGKVSTAISHKVANPAVKVGVSAEFDAAAFNFNAEKFGLSLSFGDF